MQDLQFWDVSPMMENQIQNDMKTNMTFLWGGTTIGTNRSCYPTCRRLMQK